MVKGKPVKVVTTTALGAPKGISLQVVPEAGSWPPTEKSCDIKLPPVLSAGQAKNYTYPACPACFKCLKAMGFKCGDRGKFKVRVRAIAANNAVYAPSEWSADGLFKPVCEGAASVCPVWTG